ncbi:MAG: anthranilate synthase component I [Acidimicrobiales bacterium]
MTTFTTDGGIEVTSIVSGIDVDAVLDELTDRLDGSRGVLLSSSYEYPGRYTRWDMGFVDPPLVLTSTGQQVTVEALNDRGKVLVGAVADAVRSREGVADLVVDATRMSCRIERPTRRFEEEERSRQPSTFSVVRAIIDLFACDDPFLGLYGAFGYDLAFQFEPIELTLPRPDDQRDLVLYLPDEIVVVDHQNALAQRISFDFATSDGQSTAGIPRSGPVTAYEPDLVVEAYRDHEEGGYAQGVKVAREYFARGDLFEVVTSQTFVEPSPEPPSELFRRLKEQNPSPYGFLINLGENEWLVGASPEMYVRVEGDRVETCPISGTIARGQDSIDDASQILALLNSEKDESELTMCTDVDRNDKSRICVPGSVKVIGRRQIEMYSRLIHTVDHVEGRLRPEMDALDAFLTHTWAVTVTGAPKTKAMMFLETHERSSRAWYGGAVGKVGFDGGLNTGLTLRTIRVKDGRAEVRVGATLLWDSDPAAEEAETELKASAFLHAIKTPRQEKSLAVGPVPLSEQRILLIDHMDSFVHTLANYLRQTGAHVTTRRAGFPLSELLDDDPTLLVLSPGPGRPDDFDVSETLQVALDHGLPVFGVCLGLQGIVEHAGGTLAQLDTPMHGKPSTVKLLDTDGFTSRLFEGIDGELKVGRYHSLHAVPSDIPPSLAVTAISDDGIVMAIEHRDLPIAAVQFHPESIMSLDDEVGMRIVTNAVQNLVVRTNEEGHRP